uniref:Uncharacterized protein n=1 Tax=Falco tinnunculus TaxID=100819 RepID=A0A8C4TQ45_FALTI
MFASPHYNPLYFGTIPKKPIVKLAETESADASPFWHLMTAGKKYAANSGLTTGFWSAVNEGPQGRQAVCYRHLPLLSNRQHVLLCFQFSGKIV